MYNTYVKFIVVLTRNVSTNFSVSKFMKREYAFLLQVFKKI